MRSLMRALVLGVVATALAGEAWADRRLVEAMGPNLPLPGSPYEDARSLKLADGQRLVCDSDPDKPKFDQPRYMDPPTSRGAVRIRRCAVFAPGPNDVWHLGEVPSLAGPARLWMVFVEQGTGGRFRLAQLSLWAKRDGWDKVAAALAELKGPSTAGTDRFLSWQDDQFDTTMFVDEKYPDEFAVSVGDVRLRRLMRSPGLNYYRAE